MPRVDVDENTGEILREPDFVKLYIKNLCESKSVSGRQASVFNFMLLNMNEHNEVSYGKPSKDRFIANEGTSNATFNNNIKALIKAQLIERVGKGAFRVNKKYAVKVEWSRVKSIVWTTEFTKGGKKETVTFNEGE